MMGLTLLAALGMPMLLFGWESNAVVHRFGLALSWVSPVLLVAGFAWAILGKKSEKPWTYWQMLGFVAVGGFMGITIKALVVESLGSLVGR